MRRYSFLSLLAMMLLLNMMGTASLAAAYALRNEKIEVHFGDHGLTAVKDLALKRTVKFAYDRFSVTIDGAKINSELLTSKDVEKQKNQLTYSFDSARYFTKVVYELKPGWRFVSKQLFITDKESGGFRVNDVAVFRCRLDGSIASDYTIRTAKPGFIKHHQLKDYGAFLRFDSSWGAFVLVQNPFLTWQRADKDFSITYPAEMDWKAEYGSFPSDRGCIGTYQLTGRRNPRQMVEEWVMADEQSFTAGDGMDQAEVEAFIDCVHAFLLVKPDKSNRVHVPWCENDYQIDVATDEGVAEWKRIVDMAADLGIQHMLYTCRNNTIATRAEAADAWHWEHLLWLNMGPKIRSNEWNPKTDTLPKSTRELQDYANSKNVKLMAYVYPSLPFSQNQQWLFRRHPNDKRLSASLGVRSFQDWLVENLGAFYKRLGLGGYAFDYMFMWQPGTSRYAQWAGCRRVLEELRKQAPDIVIDGRQSYHNYGPWTWLAGSYPHPTDADEQPESFTPFPDLHFDRVSANRQRYTAWRYRNRQFCPVEIMPGFISHQSPRHNDNGETVLTAFRRRDWDYLGWKYSLFSSIATAPFNHVVSMLPARDPDEYKHFSKQDKVFFRRWLDWTDRNAETLKHIRTIIGQPALGRIDGTAAIDNDRGYVFLFNPNHRKLAAEFELDGSIGLTEGKRFVLRHLYPEEGKMIAAPETGIWKYGDTVSIPMDGTSALVLELEPASEKIIQPTLFNALGKVRLRGKKLVLTEVEAEVGSRKKLLVLLPSEQEISKVIVNGRKVDFLRNGDVVAAKVRFGGAYFSHCQQVGCYEPGFSGGKFTGTFTIPKRIFQQLQARGKAWPIAWTQQDYQTTWLVPERLLLFVQIAEPDENMDVKLKIEGQSVELKKAYSSVRVHSRCFVGFYADLSLLKSDKVYKVELELPSLKPGQFQGLFFENVQTEYTTNVRPHQVD